MKSGQKDARQVRAMFSKISSRYDLLNRLLSFSLDVHWRAASAKMIRLAKGASVLDLGVGTGDLALLFAKRPEVDRVVGVDFASPMLELARRKARKGGTEGKVGLLLADALDLPVRDSSMDAVVSAFLMRNILDLRSAFAEMVRVTKPGGKVAVLELCPDAKAAVVHQLWSAYMKKWVPFLGRKMFGASGPYEYLAGSLAGFPDSAKMSGLMERAGLSRVQVRKLGLGVSALVVGVKA